MKTVILGSALLLASAGSAFAGDYNWAGAYAGAHVGYAWGSDTVNDKASDWCSPGDSACIKNYVGPFGFSPDGVIGGGTVGYNWQYQALVFGVEGDLGYLGLSGENNDAKSSYAPFHQTITMDGGLYGDVTGRIGVLVTPETLVYAKGGFVFFDGEGLKTTPKPGYTSTGTDTFTGYTIGGGVERFLTSNISMRIEYQHMSFGDQDSIQTNVSDKSSPLGYQFHNTHDLDADSIKVGVAYHFN